MKTIKKMTYLNKLKNIYKKDLFLLQISFGKLVLNQKNKIEFKKINVYNKEMSVNLNNLSIEELKKIKKR